MGWHKAASTSDVKEGYGLSVTAPGRRKPIALFRSSGELFAVTDECSHAYAPLSESQVKDYIVTCRWHGAQFDVRNGKGIGPLAYADLRTFPVRVQGDTIEVEI